MSKLVRFAVVAVSVAAVVGCGSAPIHPHTDVAAIPGFETTMASNINTGTGNILLSGKLQYEGTGNLKEVFLSYLDAMTSLGWTVRSHDMAGEKATASLSKDNRTCTVEFTGATDQVKALVQVK